MAARIVASRRMAVTVEDMIAASGEIGSHAVAAGLRARPAPAAKDNQANHQCERPERDCRRNVHGWDFLRLCDAQCWQNIANDAPD